MADITFDELRARYSRLGITLSDADIEALLPIAVAFEEGAVAVEALLASTAEPAVAFRLPGQSSVLSPRS